jgi:uncharacterized protein (DUF362 family)
LLEILRKTHMPHPTVAIAHGTDPFPMVREALGLIGAARVVTRSDRIVLKPNYVEPMIPDSGVTTDPRVIEAVIDWLQTEIRAEDITIAESTWERKRTQRAFELVGLPELAKRRGVKLLNLYDDEHLEVEIPNALSLKKVLLPRTVLEADCLISIPKLKCHCMAYVTLGIKNLMGAVFPHKHLMHRDLDERLCDLASVLRAKLTVIDGLIGAERHENAGSPVKTDVIIAGLDPVATDAVGAMVMSIDPARVDHLRLCHDRGLGEHRPDHITLLGAALDKVRKKYKQPGGFR